MIVEEEKINYKMNIFLIILLCCVFILCFFPRQMEIFLHLKPNIHASQSTQIHFIDVGQGDAIAIKFPNNKVMLIDSGTKEYQKKYINYLNNIVLNGSKDIDLVVLTHPDIDHSGNMNYILNNYNVNTFYRPAIYELYEDKYPNCENEEYRKIIQTLLRKKIDTKVISTQILYEGFVKINIISPVSYLGNLNNLSTNNFSPIIVIEDNGKKILFGGDMSEDVEEVVLENYDNNTLDVDILKLSHHGSKYSNSMKFIEATSPDYVIAMSGENTYGHPANETLSRLLEYDEKFSRNSYSNFYCTHTCGNIIFSLENEIKNDIITNIDDYNFVSFYIYAIIVSLYIIYILMKPYYKKWKKNRRFVLQNKHYTYRKEQEKQFVHNK